MESWHLTEIEVGDGTWWDILYHLKKKGRLLDIIPQNKKKHTQVTRYSVLEY